MAQAYRIFVVCNQHDYPVAAFTVRKELRLRIKMGEIESVWGPGCYVLAMYDGYSGGVRERIELKDI